jgi:hypothetical protein
MTAATVGCKTMQAMGQTEMHSMAGSWYWIRTCMLENQVRKPVTFHCSRYIINYEKEKKIY